MDHNSIKAEMPLPENNPLLIEVKLDQSSTDIWSGSKWVAKAVLLILIFFIDVVCLAGNALLSGGNCP